MPLESQKPPAVGTEQLESVLAQIDVPDDIHNSILELSQRYGPEFLTAVLGYVSIYLINRGSSKYGELNGDIDEKEERAIKRDASEQIAIGNFGMATTAFASGNPLFAIPEVVLVLAALKTCLENRFPKVASFSEAARLDLIVKMAAIGVGGYVTYEHAENVMQALPPLGLTALSVAFSSHMRQEVYRVLTLSGGTGLVVGSAYSAYESAGANNAVGVIMSIAFLALNALFTKNEWKETQKMGGLKKVVAGACDAVWQKIRGFTGFKKDSSSEED